MIIFDVQRLKMLSPAEMQLIHAGACRLLAQVGVKVAHEGIAEKLRSRGARFTGGRIFIPPEMVGYALAETAKTISFAAPDPAYAFTVNTAENLVKFGTGGQALYIVQPAVSGWQRRPAGTEDLKQILALCNRLENVDFITRPVEADVPEERMDVEKARIFREYCSKPMNLANLVKVERLDEVLEIVGNPAYVSFIISLVSSPLIMDSAAGEKFMALVEKIFLSPSLAAPRGARLPFPRWGAAAAPCLAALWLCLANIIRPGPGCSTGAYPLLPISIPTGHPAGASRRASGALPLRRSSAVFTTCPVVEQQGYPMKQNHRHRA